MTRKRICVIAFKFAPYPGVGANRWNNLCEEFTVLGHSVHVISSDWSIYKSSQPKQISSAIELNQVPLNIFQNIFFWLEKNAGLKIFAVALNFIWLKWLGQDEASLSKNSIFNFFEKLHEKEKFDVVITTCSPFSLCEVSKKIKDKYQDITSIIDLRDPYWNTSHDTPQGFFDNRAKRKLSGGILNANYVTTVSKHLQELYSDIFSINNVVSIRNGFGRREIENLPASESSCDQLVQKSKTTIIHSGSVTNGRSIPLLIIASEISKIAEEQNRQVEIILQGYIKKSDAQKIQKFKNDFFSLTIIPPQTKILSLVETSKCDLCLHLNAKQTPYALSTKIFEYLAMRKPIISINFGGEIDTMLTGIKSALSINLIKRPVDKYEHELRTFLSSQISDKTYDVFQFSYSASALDFLALFDD